MSSERDALAALVAALLDRHDWAKEDELGADRESVVPTSVWDSLTEAGIANLCSPDNGGELADAITVATVVGAKSASIPLTESAGIASWLLGEAGIPAGPGALTVAGLRDDDNLVVRETAGASTLTGTLHRVPWGVLANQVVAVQRSTPTETTVVVLPEPTTTVRGHNIAGEPRDTLHFMDTPVPPTSIATIPVSLENVLARAALLRAASMAGACRQVLDLTLDHAAARTQFDRPIATFQAVQHHLAQIAEHTASVDVAIRAASLEGESPTLLSVATAKVTAGRAAAQVTRRAHQVVGAVGTTREHPLHRFTTRLWAWQTEYGSERRWSRKLGEDVLAHSSSSLWAYVAAQPSVQSSKGQQAPC